MMSAALQGPVVHRSPDNPDSRLAIGHNVYPELRWLTVILIAGWCYTLHAQSTSPARLVARFVDGTILEGSKLSGWGSRNEVPSFENRPLFQPPALQWLATADQAAAPVVKNQIEFWNGDRLPGRVLQAVPLRHGKIDSDAPHLLVQPAYRTPWPDQPLRVDSQEIRRISWNGAFRPYQPKSLWTHDGGRSEFRSLRWSGQNLRLLTESGLTTVALKDVEEVHFAQRDVWQLYLDSAARNLTDLSQQWTQISTMRGLVVTGSTARFEPTSDERQNGLHGIQPSWSLDTIWIDVRQVRLRLFFDADRVPLTCILPLEILQRSPLQSKFKPTTYNTTEIGAPLRDSKRHYGWGFGVHAYSKLTFPLPDYAVSFRSVAALARHVGPNDGCVKIRVISTPTNKPLTSDFLVGSDTSYEVKDFSLKAGKVLQLEALIAHEGRPQNTDPLDVRDSLNWLEPEIKLDRSAIQAHLKSHHLGNRLSQLRGWELDKNSQVSWRSFHDQAISDRGRFRWAFLSSTPLVFKRTLGDSETAERLTVLLSHHRPQDPHPRAKVRINGATVAEWEVPVFAPGHTNPQPQQIEIPASQRKPDTLIELVLEPSETAATVHQLRLE